MKPDQRRLHKVCERTWPPREAVEAGPWTLRDGAGGGKRVSAATQRAAFDADVDVPAAEEAMRILGQDPLFMIRQGEDALDQTLAARGYRLIDKTNMYVCPVDLLTDQRIPLVCAFTMWEPLAIMNELWAAAGIDDARLQVMHRAKGPKTGLFGRINDQPAGVGFCGLHKDVAMVHALEISEPHQRHGLGNWMMRVAAHWAADWDARWLSVLCTEDNAGANAFYAALGMQRVGSYHYRILLGEET